MDFVMESNGGNSGDEQGEICHSGNGKKEAHRRHASHQIQALEAYFKQCPHPDENQRRHLSKELGLELKQIKFWFQNKRTQAKTQHERFDNTVLRAENERIQCENQAIREALKNVICSSCGGPPLAHPQLNLHNANLKEKPKTVSLAPMAPTPSLDLPFSRDKVSMPVLRVTGIERAAMCETAAAAMDELVRLLSTNEPLWVKSLPDGRYVIHRENYEKAFPRATHLPSSSARIESSKDSALVTMNAGRLVSMFLDADKWVDLFPTIVTEAKTIQVLETGMVENKNGCLQLMYERMHVLSPFVPPREFNFLRHCREIEAGVWVLVDVSYPSFFKEACSYSWKLPSGCMIQEMPNGRSKITWVEHVVADNETQTHRLFQDLVLGGSAYGSERWLVSLQRMCERFSNAEVTEPVHHIGRADSGEGWKSNIMKLSHRMVKSFSSMLNMSGQLDRSDETNNGVRVSLRHTTETGETKGITVTAATSLWLPVPSQSVLSLLKDHKIRHQWDVLCNGTPITEIANISTGNVPGNCISIIQPFIPSENNMVVLQECLEGMVVYAPISYAAMNTAMNGEDCSDIPILPSGFIVSADSRGSILTLAFQILLSSPSSSPQDLNVRSVATVNNLLTSTLQRLKLLLNCSDLD